MLRLIRVSENNYATYGVLVKESGEAFAVTLELPWKENKNKISRIPAGTYLLKKYSSDKFKNVFQIMGVPGRDKCLLHVGNFPKDTEGCVLVAEWFDGGNVAGSKAGFQELSAVILAYNKDVYLEITDCRK